MGGGGGKEGGRERCGGREAERQRQREREWGRGRGRLVEGWTLKVKYRGQEICIQ